MDQPVNHLGIPPFPNRLFMEQHQWDREQDADQQGGLCFAPTSAQSGTRGQQFYNQRIATEPRRGGQWATRGIAPSGSASPESSRNRSARQHETFAPENELHSRLEMVFDVYAPAVAGMLAIALPLSLPDRNPVRKTGRETCVQIAPTHRRGGSSEP
jgi:hypothetical protein